MTKILVIEDEEAIKDIITEMLEAEDFEVISAAQGQQGLELVPLKVNKGCTWCRKPYLI